jgi:protein-tyrosine phosphatase
VAFSVLFVCTGNVCRSPIAERLMQLRMRNQREIVASSAGMGALVGHEMDGPSALALRELGGDPTGHVARQLDRRLADACDLILTAETRQRDAFVRDDPMSFRRTFTMREFGRLGAGLKPLDSVTVDALRERVVEVAAHRGNVAPPGLGDDEIGDPFGADLEVARLCAAQIAASVNAIVHALGVG